MSKLWCYSSASFTICFKYIIAALVFFNSIFVFLSLKFQKKREERARFQQKLDELMKIQANASSKIDLYEEKKKYIYSLLLHADIICCTLNGAGSEWMVKTFKDFQKYNFCLFIIHLISPWFFQIEIIQI